MGEYLESRQRQHEEVDAFIEKYMFFAFSQQQLEEGLRKFGITKEEAKGRLVSGGAGGYILKDKVDEWVNLVKSHENEIRSKLGEKDFAYELIAYEGDNHEYGYTRSVEDMFQIYLPDITGMSSQELLDDRRITDAFADYVEVIKWRDKKEEVLEVAVENLAPRLEEWIIDEYENGGRELALCVENESRYQPLIQGVVSEIALDIHRLSYEDEQKYKALKAVYGIVDDYAKSNSVYTPGRFNIHEKECAAVTVLAGMSEAVEEAYYEIQRNLPKCSHAEELIEMKESRGLPTKGTPEATSSQFAKSEDISYQKDGRGGRLAEKASEATQASMVQPQESVQAAARGEGR